MTLTKIIVLAVFLTLGAFAIYQESGKHLTPLFGSESNSPTILIAKDGSTPGV